MKIFIFLAEGFEEIEAIAPIDVFRRAGLDVTTISIEEDLIVYGAHKVGIQADQTFSQANFSGKYLIYLPGGMPGTTNLEKHSGLRTLIEQQVTSGDMVAAICAAPSILGQMGLLKGKEAISYPGFESLLTGATISEDKIVKADNILTAKGPGVAIPFALKIVEELKGKKVAEEIASAMIL